MYWFPIVSEKYCDDLIKTMEAFGKWSGGTNQVSTCAKAIHSVEGRVQLDNVHPSDSKRTRFFTRKFDFWLNWFSVKKSYTSITFTSSPGLVSIQRKFMDQDGRRTMSWGVGVWAHSTLAMYHITLPRTRLVLGRKIMILLIASLNENFPGGYYVSLWW